jgi:excisionase family DNA binding protein
MEDWLTAEQAAQELGYHVDHVRRLLRAGKLRGQLFNRTWIIARQEVDRLKALQNLEGRLPYGLEPEQ